MVKRAEKKEGILGSKEPHFSLQWLDLEIFREMSFIPLCVLLPCSSHHVMPHSHYPCLGKRKPGRSLAKAKTDRTAAGAAGSDIRVFCTVFAGHIQPFTAVCSKAHLPLLFTALHLSFIAFGPQLLLPCISSPGWANLSCSIPSSLPLLLALPILVTNSLSLREPHRAWHTEVPFQALL